MFEKCTTLGSKLYYESQNLTEFSDFMVGEGYLIIIIQILYNVNGKLMITFFSK